jgi:GNAT superfamily N-acetyltransferase
VVRHAREGDADFIAHAALLATHDPAVVLPDPSSVRHLAHHSRYFSGWLRPGDFGVVAEAEQRAIGAAWCRRYSPDEQEHEVMDAEVPELVIAIVPDFQRSGIGTELMRQVLSLAHAEGHSAVELRVGAHRPWLVAAYERSGFAVVAESGRHFVMRAEVAG